MADSASATTIGRISQLTLTPNHGAALVDDTPLRADLHGLHHSAFQLVIRDKQSGSASNEGFGGGGHGGTASTLAAQVC